MIVYCTFWKIGIVYSIHLLTTLYKQNLKWYDCTMNILAYLKIYHCTFNAISFQFSLTVIKTFSTVQLARQKVFNHNGYNNRFNIRGAKIKGRAIKVCFNAVRIFYDVLREITRRSRPLGLA